MKAEQFRRQIAAERRILRREPDGSWIAYAEYLTFFARVGVIDDPGVNRWKILFKHGGRIHEIYKAIDSEDGHYIINGALLGSGEPQTVVQRAIAVLDGSTVQMPVTMSEAA